MNVFVCGHMHESIVISFLYKVIIIYCFPLHIKMANFFTDIISELYCYKGKVIPH